jgi:hypothetical protein
MPILPGWNCKMRRHSCSAKVRLAGEVATRGVGMRAVITGLSPAA